LFVCLLARDQLRLTTPRARQPIINVAIFSSNRLDVVVRRPLRASMKAPQDWHRQQRGIHGLKSGGQHIATILQMKIC
jgi:hypothetical protein